MFDKALENLKSVRLTGGLFAKIVPVLIVLCISITWVCLKNGTWWLPISLFLPVLLLFYYVFKRLFDFADANPHAAIMDGAELLSRERLLHGQKGEENLIPTQITMDHPLPLLPSLDIDIPDPSPSPALENEEGE